MISDAFHRWHAAASGGGDKVTHPAAVIKQKKAFTVGGGPGGADGKTAALAHLCISLGSKSIRKMTMEDVNEAFMKQFTDSVTK
jgi:hypothetical protein